MAPRDPYAVLGVAAGAGADEVRRAYHARCLRLHPDKAGGVQDAAAFQAVQDAWAVLGDAAARGAHDDEARRLADSLEAEYAAAEPVRFDEMRIAGPAAPRAWLCRCGAAYEVAAHELDDGPIIVPCEGCSLCIRVMG
ncbi:hypothetical protein T492DRAFT_938952 [Pavlovales sp. CCMP2436]|nr:hypothetical protein T492DRAFT_938952 [Pavlovales sp. CCMP2436]|mmetsp:Transcript_2358/g.5765  ORF Transcript_2358/g.5765 Transcript_2358/m.5765 type:complete len:138 (+) Transcript_2358:74-487(+)